MKRILSPILMLFLLASCVPGNTYNKETEEPVSIDTLNIEKFALDFYRKHENLTNNSIIKKQADKEFLDSFEKNVNSNELLKGVPMTLRTLKEEKDGKYIAHFWNSDIDRDLIQPFGKLNFDFAVKLPKDVAINLVEKSDYLLDVTYVGHLENIETFKIMVGYDDWVKVNTIELSPNDNWNDSDPQTFDINLGMMIVDFKDIKPYSKPNEASKYTTN